MSAKKYRRFLNVRGLRSNGFAGWRVLGNRVKAGVCILGRWALRSINALRSRTLQTPARHCKRSVTVSCAVLTIQSMPTGVFLEQDFNYLA